MAAVVLSGPAQHDGVEGEEICGQQASCQDLADRVCAQVVSEPGQFALDASVAPELILLRQPQHQVVDLVTEGRSTWRRCQTGSVPGVTMHAQLPGE